MESEQVFYDVIWAKNKFYAVGGLGIFGDVSGFFSTFDGETWTELESDVLRGRINGYELNSIVYSGGTFIAAGSGILVSKDGSNWHVADKHCGYTTVISTTNHFYAFNQDGRIVSSLIGEKWDELCLSAVGLNDLVSNGKQYVAVGDGIYFSEDQKKWIEFSYPNSIYSLFKIEMNAIILAKGKYIVVGNNGLILTSVNGRDWNSQISNTQNDLVDISYGNDKYVAVGRSGTILVSSDAIKWSLVKYPSSENDIINKNIYCVTWAGNQFVATGDIFSFLTSTDGIKWIARDFDAFVAFESIAWGAKKYIGYYVKNYTTCDFLYFKGWY
jgi:photosystem II stability/assembly factor-like uncharacterized protein